MNSRRTLLMCGAVLLAGAVITALIFSTEPTATRVAATKKTAMLVQVTKVNRGTYRPTIVAMGTVEPAQDIVLQPRVSGEVVDRSPAFTPGGFVKKGETLLQIDPRDYRNALKQRLSQLRQAVSELNMEMGRQNVAQKDYQLLDETLAEEYEGLVLRKPQLNAARARVEAARAAVEQVQLELERTHIKSPFDAHILSRNATVGSQVSPGDDLGRLVGLDTYWVVATVPLSKLPWLSFPKAGAGTGSEVRIRNHSAWPKGIYRTGTLYRLVGALDDRTRMARVLVSVPDPLAHLPGASDLTPLMIGTYVETRIQAKEIKDIIRLNRNYLRQDDTAWVMEDGQLHVRELEIVFRDAKFAYIASGLHDQDQVVTTNLATVVEGARLRLKGSDDSSVQDLQPETPSTGGARQ